jgi:hypothetical protein
MPVAIPQTETDLDKLIVEKQINLPSTSVGKQMVIYLVSFLLPPLGLGWGFKYVRHHDESVKRIGKIAIILTIVSIILTLWISKSFMDSYSKTLNSIGGGTGLENLGY